jgi:hypothetical protein
MFSLSKIGIMDSPTLTFIVSLAGVLILLLLGIIGWFISFIVRNQTARNEEFAEVMKDLSGSILELKKVVSEISIGCRFKHERIDKFMDDFDK